jgi:hypothetical protein
LKRYLVLAILSTLIVLSFSVNGKINLEAQEKKGVRPTVTGDWEQDSIRASISRVGNQYLVLIAINKYKHWDALENPVKDAKEIKKILETHYYIDKVIEFYDQNATQVEIIRIFKELQQKLKVDDSLLILFSGHGYLDEASGSGFWIPVDGGADENEMDNWIPSSIIRGLISKMKAKHIFLITDSCFSGKMILKGKPDKIDNRYLDKAYKKRCRLVLTAGELEKVPDKSEFARQLKVALRDNTQSYLEPHKIYGEIKLGMEKSFPLFSPIREANHQEGATFILFLKDKPKEEITETKIIGPPPSIPEFKLEDLKTKAKWAEYQEKLRQSVKEVKAFESNPNIPDNLKREAWQRFLENYKYDNPLSKEDEELREYAMKRKEYWSKPKTPPIEDPLNKIKKKPNQKGFWETEIQGHTMIYIPQLKAFVDKYEVSFELFKKNMKNKKKGSGIPLINMLSDNHPAIVTYEEAQEYCHIKGMRLLKEEEWELLAGSDKGNIYSWGIDEVDSDSIYKANFKSFKDGNDMIAPVKSYEKYTSPYGLVNLSGNVWEWVQGKKCKGGGFLSPKEDLKISRSAEGKKFVGFRCVKDVEK